MAKKEKSKTNIKDKKSRKESKSVSKTNIEDEVPQSPKDTLGLAETPVELPEPSDIGTEEIIDIKVEPILLDPVTPLFPLLISNWSGECVEGVPHGFGRCEYKSGNVFTGNMEYGLMEGKGELRLKSGFVYNGDFHKNSMQGHGRIVFPDESEYEGAVVDGHRHGQGHYVKASTGVTYAGGLKAGARHGAGIMRYSQASFYDGTFKDGLENGYGMRQWDNLDVYKGYYKDGKRHGQGHMIWKNDEEEYEGEWFNGVQNGNGTEISYLNGRKTTYRGMWKDGKRHGQGRIEYSDGSVLEGKWNNGRKVGTFDVQYSTGENEETQFVNDKLIKSSKTNETEEKINEPENDITPEHFQSLTEKELILTFGDYLSHGKEAIVRNIYKVRELYIRYSRTFQDGQFRVIHFDKLLLDFELSHEIPIVELYPTQNRNPMQCLLFREFAYYLVNTAAKLFPEMDLDNAIQHLFDNYLSRSVNDKISIFSSELLDLIPNFFLIWENCEYRMTGRHMLQLIGKLLLPFTPKQSVQFLSETDKRIPENIEREISFLQFSDTMVKLIMDYKENVVKQKWTEVAPTESEVEKSKSETEPVDVKSEVHNNISAISTRASGSLLQTISNLTDDQELPTGPVKDSGSASIEEMEIYSFVSENIIGKWIEWKRILELTKEEKIEKIYDISGLIYTSKTTICSVPSENTL